MIETSEFNKVVDNVPADDAKTFIQFVDGHVLEVFACCMAKNVEYHDGYIRIHYNKFKNYAPRLVPTSRSMADDYKCVRHEVIPMHSIRSIEEFAPSEDFERAKDIFVMGQTGMTYDEATSKRTKAILDLIFGKEG